MKTILLKMPEGSYFEMEGAAVCDKPRPGNFGGIACFFTREGATWFSTQRWLSEQVVKFKEKQCRH